MRLIVDASVAIKWVIDEPDSAEAKTLRRFTLDSVDLLWIECANILWKLVQRSHVSEPDADHKLGLLMSTGLLIHPSATLIPRALGIACALGHPVYDSLYLAAAERQQCRVVTADSRLLNKLAASAFAPLAISLQDAAAN